MGPPPLPARVASLRPASSRTTIQETELPPLPKPTVVGSAQQQPSWMQQPPRTPNQDQITPPSAQAIVYEEQETRPLSSSSTNTSPLSYKRTLSNVLPSMRPLSSLSNITQNCHRTESQSPLSTPPTSYTSHRTHAPNENGCAPEAIDDDNLAAYAMQSEEGRRAALDEFVISQLENPNFMILLEDMETCWARTTLGPK
jgi:hypothetical protein